MRSCGILMPIFSLPSAHGIGTFGREAYAFVDFLVKAGQSHWQILPLGPTSVGDSPYQSFSSYAGNPYFIDLDLLVDDGLLTADEVACADFSDDPRTIDYGKLYENRLPLLKKAFARFTPTTEFEAFCRDEAWWLDDYVLFTAIKKANGDGPWYKWRKPLRLREEAAMDAARKKYADETAFYRFVQYLFFTQWHTLKTYANDRGVTVIGDIPIYVAYDSADVWAAPSLFELDQNGRPTAVAGCPPDAFSEDGQLWGNPLYRYDVMAQDGFAWWKRRLSAALSLYDIVRIDHFRGFESYYAIPAKDKTAKGGAWRKGPGMALWNQLTAAFGDNLPIIAEDLGFLTPAVKQLLADTGFAGMKVLQFAFDSREDSDYLPHNYTKNCVVYTGTHDNDTVLGWAKTAAPEDVKMATDYLRPSPDEGLNWAMMRCALSSVANTAILTMADLVGEGSEGRINTPSKLGGNWLWRLDKCCLNDWLASLIFDLTDVYRRTPAKQQEKPETEA